MKYIDDDANQAYYLKMIAEALGYMCLLLVILIVAILVK